LFRYFTRLFLRSQHLFLIVCNLNHTDSVAVGVGERTTNTRGVLTVDECALGSSENSGDFHEEAVFEGGVVGVKLNLDVHCAATLPDPAQTTSTFYQKSCQAENVLCGTISI